MLRKFVERYGEVFRCFTFLISVRTCEKVNIADILELQSETTLQSLCILPNESWCVPIVYLLCTNVRQLFLSLKSSGYKPQMRAVSFSTTLMGTANIPRALQIRRQQQSPDSIAFYAFLCAWRSSRVYLVPLWVRAPTYGQSNSKVDGFHQRAWKFTKTSKANKQDETYCCELRERVILAKVAACSRFLDALR